MISSTCGADAWLAGVLNLVRLSSPLHVYICVHRYKLVLSDGQILDATIPNLHTYMGGEHAVYSLGCSWPAA